MSRVRTRFFVAGALLLLLIPTLAACGGSSGSGGNSGGKKVKIGLVTDTGGLNDQGFNHLAYVGLQKAIKDFGVQGDVKESKSTDDYVPFLTQFAANNYDLVIAVGFKMDVAVGTVSGQFPNVHFAIIDGQGTDANFNDLHHANVESLLFKEQEAGALVGVIAGMLEKNNQGKKNTNVIGAIGGEKIPPVDHYIAGYQWGAKHENSNIQVVVGYSGDFNDTTKCADIAKNQITNQKADIVFAVAGGCGNGALDAAGQQGVYSIGVDSDQKALNPSVIASAVKRVDTAAYDSIKDVVNNQFKGGVTTFTLANDGVGYAPGNITLSQDIINEVNSVASQIKSGAVTVPDTVQ